MDNNIKVGDVVTIDFKNLVSSNTYEVDKIESETQSILLKHPLYDKCLMRYNIDEVNTVSANIKDSTERSLDFAKHNQEILNYNEKADLESLCLYFVVNRQLTPRQKNILSNICGDIASIKFNSDVRKAMEFITRNKGLLDDFNTMWFRNFKGLFQGSQPITSKKQMKSIFNMAGFILAEMEIPVTSK